MLGSGLRVTGSYVPGPSKFQANSPKAQAWRAYGTVIQISSRCFARRAAGSSGLGFRV